MKLYRQLLAVEASRKVREAEIDQQNAEYWAHKAKCLGEMRDMTAEMGQTMDNTFVGFHSQSDIAAAINDKSPRLHDDFAL